MLEPVNVCVETHSQYLPQTVSVSTIVQTKHILLILLTFVLLVLRLLKYNFVDIVSFVGQDFKDNHIIFEHFDNWQQYYN